MGPVIAADTQSRILGVEGIDDALRTFFEILYGTKT
jgi:hypothetical protein